MERLREELPLWYLENGWIRRRYKTSGWKATLMVVNTVGHLAEAAFHHPDMTVSYAFVIVKLMNHAARGVTDKDFALARKIEEVIQWQPGKEEGPLEVQVQQIRLVVHGSCKTVPQRPVHVSRPVPAGSQLPAHSASGQMT